MAARKAKTQDPIEALEQELAQLQGKLEKAKQRQERDAETLVNKLRRGWEAARKKERSAREKVAATRAKKKTPAQQRQLEKQRQTLADARATTQALKLEMAEAQEAHRGLKANNKREAERAKKIAQASTAYDKKQAAKARARRPGVKRTRKTD